MKNYCFYLLLLLALGKIGYSHDTNNDAFESFTFYLKGTPSDWITHGKTYEFDETNIHHTVEIHTGIFSIGAKQAFRVAMDLDKDYFHVEVSLPRGIDEKNVLKPGIYLEARRVPFHDSHYGFNLSGNHRGCNTLSATFQIYRIKYNEGNEISELDMSFSQMCDSISDDDMSWGFISFVK